MTQQTLDNYDSNDRHNTDTADTNKPTKPDLDTHVVEKTDSVDGTEITFIIEANPDTGRLTWDADWPGGTRTGDAATLNDTKTAVIFKRSPEINGTRTAGIKPSDDTYTAIKHDLNAAQNYNQAVTEYEQEQKRREALELTVENITYKTGTHRTKYTQTARVLTPNKTKMYWTSKEEDLMTGLKRVLGESDGYPNAPDRYDDGSTRTAREIAASVDGVEDEIESIRDERAREERVEALRDDHPVLRGVDVDPDTVESSLTDAQDKGEDVVITETHGHCNTPDVECNIDLITIIATPDGTIEKNRAHTY